MATNNDEDFIVHHKGEQYNIAKFLHFHPGGHNSVAAYRGHDITSRLEKFEHAPSALYLMKEYKMKNKDDRGDEDLEKLVDWSQPMLRQVGQLGSRYHEWVQAPVDRQLRLFQSDFVEKLTVTPWYLIPIVWVPLSIFLLYRGLTINEEYIQVLDTEIFIWLGLSYVFGIALWSLLEYTLHRWLFHLQPPDDSPRLITAHFLMHGLHHKVPFDDQRLLIPPVPGGIAISIIYSIFRIIFPYWMVDVISAGTLTGYIIYDLMHFYLHYGSPRADSYLYNMKRYHNQHHFSQDQNGFGISSMFWDRIFGTQIFLRKLKWALKW